MIVPSKIVPNQSIRAARATRIAARAVQPRLAMIVAAMAAFVVAGAERGLVFPLEYRHVPWPGDSAA